MHLEVMCRRSPHDFSVENLAALIKLGNFFQHRWAPVYAKQALDGHPGLDTARRVNIARRFGFDEWIKAAFERLAELKQQDFHFSEESIALMGTDFFSTVLATRIKLASLREQAATVPPPLVIAHTSGSAPADRKCDSMTWTLFWHGIVAKRLLARNQDEPIHDIGAFILSKGRIPGICDSCVKATAAKMEEKAGVARQMTQTIIGNGVRCILERGYRLLESQSLVHGL